MSRNVLITIGANPPSRLDKALARDVPEEAHLSRSRIAKLLAQGAVKTDGQVISDAKTSVSEGDIFSVSIDEPAETHIHPEDIQLTIVHEDDDLIVVDKPAGMVVHPAPGTPSGTLVNALLHHFGSSLSGVGGTKRPGIVHRIDKDTSGLLVVAKSDAAHHGLAEQFANHSVERRYLALCHGVPHTGDPRLKGLRGISFESGDTVKITSFWAATKRIAKSRPYYCKGRHAVTRAQLIETFGDQAALVCCRLETGRTHQIRVHMAYIGHALLGDPVYGGRRKLSPKVPGAREGNSFGRQALHAETLSFVHPVSDKKLSFESPLPEDLHSLLQALRDM